MKVKIIKVIVVIFTLLFCGNLLVKDNINKNNLQAAGDWVIQDKTLLAYKGSQSTVTIPSGVTEIGEGAFSSNSKLVKVILPDEVTSIGLRAFSGCRNLSEINIEKVTYFGEACFESTSILDTYVNADIPLGMFAYSQLKTVKTGPNCTSIGSSAFYSCNSLEHIELSSSIYTIGASAFFKCTKLVNVILPDNLQIIGSRAFYETAIKSIKIPGTVKKIESLTFCDCASLSTLIINEGTEVISSNAIGKTSITSVYIPSTVKEIGWSAFSDNDKLERVEVSDENENYASENGILYTKDFSKALLVPRNYAEKLVVINANTKTVDESFAGGLQNVTKVVLPEGMTELYYRSFENSSKIEEVILPSTLTKIYAGSFNRCTKLYKITLPSSLTYLGDSTVGSKFSGGVFENCSSLRDIVIPDSVTSLGFGLFSGCSSLESVYIPKDINDYGENIFKECSNLKQIIVASGNKYAYTIDGVYYEIRNNENILAIYPAKREGKTFTTPEDVKNIGPSAFSCVANLEELTISSAVTTIGDGAFEETTSLKKVVFKNNMKKIPNDSFFNSSIEQVVLPDSLEEIGDRSFSFCKNLKHVSLPSTLKTLNYLCFYNSGLEEVVIPDGVTDIEQSFMDCKKLARVTLPNSLKTIMPSSFANTLITEITIPESLIVIPDYAFNNCTSLETVNLPKTIVSFSLICFTNCPKLKDINIDEENKYIKCQDGILYNEDFTKLLFVNKTQVAEKIIFPDTLTEITQDAFNKDQVVKEVVIPKTLETFGYRCFLQSAFEKVTFEEGFKVIPEFLFYECYNLKDVVIPASVEKIGTASFEECTSLEKLVLPENIDLTYAYSAFEDCSMLKEINLPSNMSVMPQFIFRECVSLQNIIIPETVVTIEEGVFMNCTSLKSVVIPASVEGIKYGIFRDSSIKSIIFLGNAPVFIPSSFGSDYFPEDATIYVTKNAKGFKNSNYLAYSSQIKQIKDDSFTNFVVVDVINTNDNEITINVNSIYQNMIRIYQKNGEDSLLLYEGENNSYKMEHVPGGKTYDFIAESIVKVNSNEYKSLATGSIYIEKSQSEYEIDYLKRNINSYESFDNYTDKELEPLILKVEALDEYEKTDIVQNTNYAALKTAYDNKKLYREDLEKITTISFRDVNTELKVGDTSSLEVVFPADVVNKDYKLTSSNSGIIFVDEDGNVKALSSGKATVTAEALNGVKTTIVFNVSMPKTKSQSPVIFIVIGVVIVMAGITVFVVKKRGIKNA